MRFKTRKNGEWYNWFAWYPVCFDPNDDWIWLEWVECRYCVLPWGRWVYRLPYEAATVCFAEPNRDDNFRSFVEAVTEDILLGL
jgi:hypothetical protein